MYKMFFLVLVWLFGTHGKTGDPILINEILASHDGKDDTEYIELYGRAGQSLAGLSVILIECDRNSVMGKIDRRIDFTESHIIGPKGFFLIGNPDGLQSNYSVVPKITFSSNFIENSSVTIVLVETNSLQGNYVKGLEVVVDGVSLIDSDIEDTSFFNTPRIGPDGNYFPAGAGRISDGVDTDAVSDWKINDFFLGSGNTPMGGDKLPPPSFYSIMEIQGNGHFSPLLKNRVETNGIVTLFSNDTNNFWIQDPSGDGDSSTSDGLFIKVGRYSNTKPKPEIGDRIYIIGKVQEFQTGKQLPLTQLINIEKIFILSQKNSLPMAKIITTLPNFSIPKTSDYWEPLEGMRIVISNAPVIAPTTKYGEFTILAPGNAQRGSGYIPCVQQIFLRKIAKNSVDYNSERIIVDDGTLDRQIDLRPGDTITKIEGIVDYTFGNYKIQPQTLLFSKKPLPDSHTKRIPCGWKGRLRVTTFNVENLFDCIDNPEKKDEGSTPTPEELEIKLEKLTCAISNKLDIPDILCIQEVENQLLLQQLGDRVNKFQDSDYRAISFETSDVRGIEVGFLYNDKTVNLLSAFQMQGSKIDSAFGLQSTSPGREPIVGIFSFEGTEITIIGNHFKSKGGDDPLYCIPQPPKRKSEIQRKSQARAVRSYIDSVLQINPLTMLIVMGDFNDFEFGEPDEGQDHPIAILKGNHFKTNLLNGIDLIPKMKRYTYIYEGNSQVLDHLLVSQYLAFHIVDINILHFNASYPASFTFNPTTALRCSDHDPIEISLFRQSNDYINNLK